MAARVRIDVTGLREFQAALRRADADLPKALRLVLNDAANLVIDWARPRIPKRTGAAAGSIKARSSQREVRVAVGGRRAPYYPWLDFGGRTGPARSVVRPFYTEGRYLYPGLRHTRDDVQRIMEEGITRLAADAGLEAT
ncbi:MAG TPA: HK97 gp10 family phage protein [Nocardioides sp.]|nr:HK97 gp10 family phage protein [Nocardioides sp.]